jgi:hypothetical protein
MKQAKNKMRLNLRSKERMHQSKTPSKKLSPRKRRRKIRRTRRKPQSQYTSLNQSNLLLWLKSLRNQKWWSLILMLRRKTTMMKVSKQWKVETRSYHQMQHGPTPSRSRSKQRKFSLVNGLSENGSKNSRNR